MKPFDFTVFGCAASVCMLKVRELPQPGRTVWVQNPNAEVFNGGVGFNISCGLSSLGARVYPVLSIPDDRLEQLVPQHFAPKFGWPTDGLLMPPEGCYRRCYIFQDENRDHMTVMYRYGAHALEEPDRQPLEVLDRYLNESRMVVFASPRPINTPVIYEALVRHGIPYVFSYRNDKVIFPSDVLQNILLGAHILFMNEAEAKQVTEQYGLGHIRGLFSHGQAQVIVTTLGRRGCIVYSRGACSSVQEIAVPITENALGNVDAVGAGDSFLSGFMYGYSQGKSLETCAQFGSTMSSFVIEKEGSTTNLPTLPQLLERNRTRPDARED